jgi:hypothetical protein
MNLNNKAVSVDHQFPVWCQVIQEHHCALLWNPKSCSYPGEDSLIIGLGFQPDPTPTKNGLRAAGKSDGKCCVAAYDGSIPSKELECHMSKKH